MPSRLVLFDIDGTLLTTHRRGWENPFKEAIERSFQEDGTPVTVDTSQYRPGGKTDPQIVYELLEGSGVADETITKILPKIQKKYVRRLRDTIRGPQHAELKPGVKELLAELDSRKELLLGLLTGNFEEGARIKLETHGLNKYFPFGAFGDGARKRSELPERALEAAKQHAGHTFSRKNIVIIGDTPNDIHCGRHLHVRTLAVATGPFSMEQLEAEGPDFVFQNLTETQKVLMAILEDLPS